TASCSGTTCSYACDTGASASSDCNSGTAPDTDGCECATPGCCGVACETIHSNGVGQNYYDCNNLYTPSPNTFTPIAATEACTAWAISQGKTAAACSDGWKCSGGSPTVCYSTDGGNTCATYCWGYTSAKDAGWVETCSCPEAEATSYD